jgi:hypothetical protein
MHHINVTPSGGFPHYALHLCHSSLTKRHIYVTAPGGAISQLETELNSHIDAIKAQREAERIPEVTQVFGLTMAAALEKRERGRAIPPPPGWPDFTGLKITPDEEPRPNWVRPKKVKPLPDVGGVPGN